MNKPLFSLTNATIAVLASFGRDADTLVRIVERARCSSLVCASTDELVRWPSDNLTAVLITEESLIDAAGTLLHYLANQGSWSDLPIIILSGGRGKTGTPARWKYFRQFGNVTILDRPLSAEALVISIEAACRSRAWQYVVRQQMQQLENHNTDLELAVRERTLALQLESDERKRIESALNEARRLEAIGRLTGGIAHDFNNLLQVIASASNLLPYALKDETRRDKLLSAIRHATQRGSKLTQQMLAFGRRQVLATDTVLLKTQILGMEELLKQSLREKIELRIEVEPDVWPVHVDVTQLEVALLNLTINAKDALTKGGNLVIAAHNVHLPSANISANADIAGLQGDFVCLSVADNGPGMPPEVAAQAFEPFFTTKRVGEGSGLGLSQVYGFARQSGGTAWIKSGPEGTTVAMLLPRSNQVPDNMPRPKQSSGFHKDQLKGVRVLCVEDDDEVAQVTIALLSTLGCKTRRANSADDALRLELDEFDIVFSDVQMPGTLDGIGLAREIARRRPGLPVVLTSGFVVAPERLREVRLAILRKPYDIESLRTALLGQLENTGSP